MKVVGLNPSRLGYNRTVAQALALVECLSCDSNRKFWKAYIPRGADTSSNSLDRTAHTTLCNGVCCASLGNTSSIVSRQGKRSPYIAIKWRPFPLNQHANRSNFSFDRRTIPVIAISNEIRGIGIAASIVWQISFNLRDRSWAGHCLSERRSNGTARSTFIAVDSSENNGNGITLGLEATEVT